MSEQVNLANAQILEEYKKALDEQLKKKEQPRKSRTDTEKLHQFKDQMLSDMKDLIKQELALRPVRKSNTVQKKKPREPRGVQIDTNCLTHRLMKMPTTTSGGQQRAPSRQLQKPNVELDLRLAKERNAQNDEEEGDEEADPSQRSVDFAETTSNVEQVSHGNSGLPRPRKPSSFQYSTS